MTCRPDSPGIIELFIQRDDRRGIVPPAQLGAETPNALDPGHRTGPDGDIQRFASQPSRFIDVMLAGRAR